MKFLLEHYEANRGAELRTTGIDPLHLPNLSQLPPLGILGLLPRTNASRVQMIWLGHESLGISHGQTSNVKSRNSILGKSHPERVV